MKLFDQLVKPIALYGAEICGMDLLNGNDNEAVLKKLTSLMCEKLNIQCSLKIRDTQGTVRNCPEF